MKVDYIEAMKLALEALEANVIGTSGRMPKTHEAITALREALAEQQEPVSAIRALTDQCFALVQERDELQKQVWRYEKNGVTCQTYRHKVDASCAECNVHEVYTSPPAQRKPLTDEEIKLVMDGRGEEGDDDYVKPAFDPFGISEDDLMNFARAIEAKLKEKNNG